MTAEQQEAWHAHYDSIAENFYKKEMSEKEFHLWKYQRYMRDYLACVQSVDDNIGRTLKHLEEQGLLDNTLIVYTSDQGFYTGEHGWFDKRFMYEQSLRTPLLMRFPKGYKGNIEVNEMVQNIDYASTFLDFAGIEIPESMQGKSLLPLVSENGAPQWRNSIYYHYYEFPNEHMVKRHYGIRTARYKLIHFYNDIDTWELYDLETDPNEMNNIYDNPENEVLIADLKKQLTELQKQYKDTDTSTY
jgi:arylsulfatase A-like enzyme